MDTNDVIIGGDYLAKVSGREVPVRIMRRLFADTGRYHWHALNQITGREITIKSAKVLRRLGSVSAEKVRAIDTLFREALRVERSTDGA
jgi:hypothetical protein